MLRKSLFLLLTVALAAGLMFAGCQQDVEYREVQGPTVTLPGNDTETTVPGPEKEVPVYVNADITVDTALGLRDALSNPDYDVIAVVVNPNTTQGVTLRNNSTPSRDRGDLVIPPGKTLYLYTRLEAGVVTPPITIDVQGELVIGYGGTLSAGVEHQVKVSAGGSIKVQDTGVLETDVPASVNDGAATVLGTPQVLIDGYGKDYPELVEDQPVGKPFMGPTLRYTNSVDQWALIETAFDTYITQGILDLSSAYFKSSDLIKLVTERPASVGKKAFKAKALVDETATALTIPVNAYISTDSDSFAGVTTLTVNGHLDTGTTLAGINIFNSLTSFTIAGGAILRTNSGFNNVIETDIALGGSLFNTQAQFPLLRDLTVNGRMELNNALFTQLETLNITANSYLETGNAATFGVLKSLTMGDDARFIAPAGTFAQLDNALTVNGIFRAASTGAATIFGELDELVVNGELTVGNGSIVAFDSVSTLTVTGKGNLDLQSSGDHFVTLSNLTVENGARITSLGGSSLNSVTDLTVRGLLDLPTPAWTGLLRVTVTETGGFKAAAGTAYFNTVTDLTLNGTFEAPNGIFGAITNVEGAGALIAGGNVAVTPTNKARILYESPLTSVSLGSQTAFDITAETTITVPAGKTRAFTDYRGATIAKKIVVESGATLELGGAAAPTALVDGGPNGLIEVSGTLRFTGAGGPVAPITVKEGGALIFDGDNAVPEADITVASGATLAFNGANALPEGNITVNGTLVVGNGADFALDDANNKILTLNGTLNAGDLTAQGFVFPDDPAIGGTFSITGNYTSGSTITVRIETGTETQLKFQPNGYIRDIAAKSPWSLEGGNATDFGRLVLVGDTTTTITLGQGKIVTNKAPTTSLGVVNLRNGAHLVAKPYSGPGQAVGLTLDDIIIDLTTAGKIVVEPGSKLNLANPIGGSAITGAGVIRTKSDATVNTALVGKNVMSGDLTTGLAGVTNLTIGVINGGTAGKTIDADDTFVILADNITVTRN